MTRRSERSHYEAYLGASSPESRSPRWLGIRDSRLFQRALLLAALCLAAGSIASARADEPPLKTLQYNEVQEGTRVRVTRVVGTIFVGTVVSRTDDAIRLDLAGEPNGVNATITFPAKSITKIELLKGLSEAEMKAIQQERQARAVEAREAERSKAPARVSTAGKTPAERPAETEPRPVVTDAQAALLRAFPTDQWGVDRLAEIRRRWITLGLAPSQTESDFVTRYPQWTQAVAQLEALKQWEIDHRDVILLENFPPKDGWSSAKHDTLTAKQAGGGVLTETEAGFLQVFPEWLKAYEAEQKAKKPAGKSETQPEKAPQEKAPEASNSEHPQKVVPEKQQELPPPDPATEKPAEKPVDKPVEKPADVPAEPVPDHPKP